MIIQLLIQCSDIDIHIRMCFLHSFYTFGCSDDAQQTDALAALVLSQLDGGDGRTAGSQHGIYHEYLTLCTVCRQLAVIFYRL